MPTRRVSQTPAAASRTIAIVMAKISIFFIVLSSRPHRVYPQVVRWNEDILHLTRRRVNKITIILLNLCIFYKTNTQQSVFHRPKTDKFRTKRGRGAAFFSFRLPFGSQPSAFSSADSATGGADFKRPSKREVLSLHHRNLREIHLIYCLDRKCCGAHSLSRRARFMSRFKIL